MLGSVVVRTVRFIRKHLSTFWSFATKSLDLNGHFSFNALPQNIRCPQFFIGVWDIDVSLKTPRC